MGKKVKTTVIGSYPVNVDTLEYMNGYFNQTEVSWNKYIDSAVNDMVDAGIDIVSDGQTRDPFVHIFARKLKGCRVRDRPEVIDKVEYDGPITVDEFIHPEVIIDVPEETLLELRKMVSIIRADKIKIDCNSKRVSMSFFSDDGENSFEKVFENTSQKEYDSVDMLVSTEIFIHTPKGDYILQIKNTGMIRMEMKNVPQKIEIFSGVLTK